MADEVLGQGQLNRALLARQHLLRRTTRPLPQVLADVGGLQVQYAPSGYIGCWTRMAGFRRDDLTAALERREVVQATLLRATIHLVAADDYPVLRAATRRALQEWWLRTAAAKGLADPEGETAAAAAQVERWLRAEGPLTRAEVLQRLEDLGVDRSRWEGIALWLDLLRVPPQGTWARRRAHLFGLAGTELAGRGSPPPADERAGLRRLVERHLGGFGPAAPADIASWGGVPVGWLGPVLDELPLRRFRREDGGVLVDLPDLPLPDADVPAPVRFLPTWDATLLAHARRTGVLPEVHRPRVFSTRMPQSVGTVLVDGRVAALWRPGAAGAGASVVVEPLEDLSADVQAEVAAEAAALTAFMA